MHLFEKGFTSLFISMWVGFVFLMPIDSVATDLPLFAQTSDPNDPYGPSDMVNLKRLEQQLGRPLQPSERDFFARLHTNIDGRQPSSVLLCARGDLDVYASASFAICTDRYGQLFSMSTIGAGFAMGISGNAFVLWFRAQSQRSSIVGRYYGSHLGVAMGPWGAIGGVYLRRAKSGGPGRDQIYFLGYDVGVSIDISINVLSIQRLNL